jgi:hypothetical protein
MAAHIASQGYDGHLEGPSILEQVVLGRDIYVYSGRGGCVGSIDAPYLVDSWHSAILAHTPFGDSTFKFRLPNLR